MHLSTMLARSAAGSKSKKLYLIIYRNTITDEQETEGNIELYEERDKKIAFENFVELKQNKFIESAAFGNWTLIDSIIPEIPDIPSDPVKPGWLEGGEGGEEEEIPDEWYDEPEEDEEEEEEEEEEEDGGEEEGKRR